MAASHDSPHDSLILTVDDPNLVYSYSLVLSAVHIPHRINCQARDHHEIYVAEQHVHKAQYEIAAYTQENQNWPTSPPKEDTFAPTFLAMSPIIIGLLIYIFAITGDWAPESLWFAKGAGDSNAILNNLQFYRLITALTLHADIVHLLGNCFLGGILLHFLLHITGNGIGLITVLATATFANFINVIIHGQNHHFVGFSTAIFSIIGMLCTISFARKTVRPLLHFFMPVMAGLALLAILGSSGERTDLGAHLFGLLCGFISGNVVRIPGYDIVRKSFLLQTLLGTTFFGVVFLSWHLAFWT